MVILPGGVGAAARACAGNCWRSSCARTSVREVAGHVAVDQHPAERRIAERWGAHQVVHVDDPVARVSAGRRRRWPRHRAAPGPRRRGEVHCGPAGACAARTARARQSNCAWLAFGVSRDHDHAPYVARVALEGLLEAEDLARLDRRRGPGQPLVDLVDDERRRRSRGAVAASASSARYGGCTTRAAPRAARRRLRTSSTRGPLKTVPRQPRSRPSSPSTADHASVWLSPMSAKCSRARDALAPDDAGVRDPAPRGSAGTGAFPRCAGRPRSG